MLSFDLAQSFGDARQPWSKIQFSRDHHRLVDVRTRPHVVSEDGLLHLARAFGMVVAEFLVQLAASRKDHDGDTIAGLQTADQIQPVRVYPAQKRTVTLNQRLGGKRDKEVGWNLA